MTPAEELRKAAARLRETGEHTTPGTWLVPDVADMVVSDKPMRWGTPIVAECGTPEDAAWIALMHPDLSEPLSAWLESWSTVELSEHGSYPDDWMYALRIARVVNGGQP